MAADTSRTMQHVGYNAFKVLSRDSKGRLVLRWHILRRETPPRPGEMAGGHYTRAAASRAAINEFEQRPERMAAE